eukprot:3209143-Pyramimonas_sp.AAC.1
MPRVRLLNRLFIGAPLSGSVCHMSSSAFKYLAPMSATRSDEPRMDHGLIIIILHKDADT